MTESIIEEYTGKVEGILLGSDREILRDLIAVIEATMDKSVKLTKSGIPPKPLWTAINERLLWSDPQSILYDWDEADQVRFIYCLSEELHLIQPDHDRQLEIGPGADQFFNASPTRRAHMLIRGYVAITDWDERCDARNEYGHRQNFGQTFRRDFLRDIEDLRKEILNALGLAPTDKWIHVRQLAVQLTENAPDILISEDDEAPDVPEGEADSELRRLVEYWVFLAARFGLVDLGRTPEIGMGEGGDRLFRLTSLGRRLLDGDIPEIEKKEQKRIAKLQPYIVQPNNDIVLYRDEADVGDEFLLRRIADPGRYPDWDDPVVTYRVTQESLLRAIDSGLDPDLIRDRLVERSRKTVPSTFLTMIDDVVRKRDKVRLTTGLTAVELDGDAKLKKSLKKSGFPVYDDLVLVPWDRWSDFCAALGEEPSEGFRYPSEEPLAKFSAQKLKLMWPVLPMVARDLLESIGLEGDPLTVTIDEDKLDELKRSGWTDVSVAEALAPLTGGSLPKRLAKLVDFDS